MNFGQYLIENWIAISVAIGGGIGYLFEGKKRKAELASIQIQNKSSEMTMKTTLETSSQEIFQKLLSTVSVQIDEMRENLAEMKEENTKLKARVLELESQLVTSNEERVKLLDAQVKSKLQSEADSLLISNLQNEVTDLKQKLESYEKQLKAFRKERK